MKDYADPVKVIISFVNCFGELFTSLMRPNQQLPHLE